MNTQTQNIDLEKQVLDINASPKDININHANQLVKTEDDKQKHLQSISQKFVQNLLSSDLKNPEQLEQNLVKIKTVGYDSQHKMANLISQNPIMKKSLSNFTQSNIIGSESITKDLGKLQLELNKCDLSKVDLTNAGGFAKIVSKLPIIGNFVAKPFSEFMVQYMSSKDIIDNCIVSLKMGNEDLSRTNNEILVVMKTLYVNLQELSDSKVTLIAIKQEFEKAIENSMVDEETKNIIRQDILLVLEEQIQDINTSMILAVQALQQNSLIRQNNNMLMRHIERVAIHTVPALQQALFQAQALATQDKYLQVGAGIKNVTENAILATAKMTREQGKKIQEQSLQGAINPEVLKKAHQDILSSMNDLNQFKTQQLDKVRNNNIELQGLIEDGVRNLEQSRNQKIEKFLENMNNKQTQEKQTIESILS